MKIFIDREQFVALLEMQACNKEEKGFSVEVLKDIVNSMDCIKVESNSFEKFMNTPVEE